VTTYSPKRSEIQRNWWVVDAEGATLGRLATEIARVLRGKHKPTFTPHIDTGDFVIVVNAEKVEVSPGKETGKLYHRHSGYPGGLKSTSLAETRRTHPDRIVRQAVKGMLPKGRLGRAQLGKLKVYAGPTHPHAAQQPQVLDVPAARRRAAV
jgi:large subunit ribosomal protein L13